MEIASDKKAYLVEVTGCGNASAIIHILKKGSKADYEEIHPPIIVYAYDMKSVRSAIKTSTFFKYVSSTMKITKGQMVTSRATGEELNRHTKIKTPCFKLHIGKSINTPYALVRMSLQDKQTYRSGKTVRANRRVITLM